MNVQYFSNWGEKNSNVFSCMFSLYPMTFFNEFNFMFHFVIKFFSTELRTVNWFLWKCFNSTYFELYHAYLNWYFEANIWEIRMKKYKQWFSIYVYDTFYNSNFRYFNWIILFWISIEFLYRLNFDLFYWNFKHTWQCMQYCNTHIITLIKNVLVLISIIYSHSISPL